ncbi:hypothetical protein [Kaarinaea lacus]
MKKLVIIVSLMLAVFSQPTISAPESSAKSLNYIMVEVGKVMLDIYPLIVAQRTYTAEDIERLDKALSQLSAMFYASAPFIDQKSDGYQISYEFISQYLLVVKRVLQTSDIDYARSHLYALGEMCASCHTQDTTLRTLFSGIKREAFPTDYAFAELNYITREYAQAIKYYEKFLNAPGRKTELNIIQPLQRIVTIHTQLQNNPRKAIQILEKYIAYKQHTPETLAELNGWISGLKKLVSSGESDIKPVTFALLKGYVEKYLGKNENLSLQMQSTAQEEVQRVWLRGQLYQYLNNQPKQNEIPMLLYWLSVLDRSIAYNFYFSLADLYLKQCVLKYPDHPYAIRCFEEFEHYLDHTYLQQGEKIPDGIMQEVIQMQTALKQNQATAPGSN